MLPGFVDSGSFVLVVWALLDHERWKQVWALYGIGILKAVFRS